ncbi:MAG: hypothetical protein CW338_09660 [Clostridiales bacterium]|nr:hypothetical protein [Clostridiales bacterium]
MLNRRTAAWVLFAILAFFAFLPLPHHDCAGEHCAVCAAMLILRSALVFCTAGHAIRLYCVSGNGCGSFESAVFADTPVDRHVLLLD